MSHYYNENDKKAVAWLKELRATRRIPSGIICPWDIRDVRHHDIDRFIQCHFFAGIGGWPLALALAGWPDTRPVWTASCPCQPFSSAGARRGEEDPRHLWPILRELIWHCRPPVILGEQVASKAGRQWFAGIRADLEDLGYAVGAADLCAAGVGAPHIRQRLFWVADTGRRGCDEGSRVPGRPEGEGMPGNQPQPDRQPRGVADTDGRDTGPEREQRGREQRLIAEDGRPRGLAHPPLSAPPRFGQLQEHLSRPPDWGGYDILPCSDGKARRIEPGTFPLAHGVPGRVGLLRGYGNAIVPRLAAEFIAAYLQTVPKTEN